MADSLGVVAEPGGNPRDDIEIYNLLRLLKEGINSLPEPKRTELTKILERRDDDELELMGRDENEILFCVGTTVFHLPIVELTKPIEGDEELN